MKHCITVFSAVSYVSSLKFMNESSVLKSFTQLAASEDDFCLTPPKLTLLAYIVLKQHIFAVSTLQKEVIFFFGFRS